MESAFLFDGVPKTMKIGTG